MTQPTSEEPTRAVTPGADPARHRSPGQADPDMVDPAAAVDAEFDPDRNERGEADDRGSPGIGGERRRSRTSPRRVKRTTVRCQPSGHVVKQTPASVVAQLLATTRDADHPD